MSTMQQLIDQVRSAANSFFEGGLPQPVVGRIAGICKERRFKKGEQLIVAGRQADSLYFIKSGLLRGYYPNSKGGDTTRNFVRENEFCNSDFLMTGWHNTCNYEALENGWALEFDSAAFKGLIHEEQALMTAYVYGLEHSMRRRLKRENSLLAKTATERYREFLQDFPDLEPRLKQTHIASYLGITPVSLSRIRRELRDADVPT